MLAGGTTGGVVTTAWSFEACATAGPSKRVPVGAGAVDAVVRLRAVAPLPAEGVSTEEESGAVVPEEDTVGEAVFVPVEFVEEETRCPPFRDVPLPDVLVPLVPLVPPVTLPLMLPDVCPEVPVAWPPVIVPVTTDARTAWPLKELARRRATNMVRAFLLVIVGMIIEVIYDARYNYCTVWRL